MTLKSFLRDNYQFTKQLFGVIIKNMYGGSNYENKSV